MYCDHLDTCSSCIQYSAHFFLQWPIPIPALDSHGPNQKLPFPDVKKGPFSILQHDSPHKLRKVNQYQLLQLENCHCSSFFPLFFWGLAWLETHTNRERERERLMKKNVSLTWAILDHLQHTCLRTMVAPWGRSGNNIQKRRSMPLDKVWQDKVVLHTFDGTLNMNAHWCDTLSQSLNKFMWVELLSAIKERWNV